MGGGEKDVQPKHIVLLVMLSTIVFLLIFQKEAYSFGIRSIPRCISHQQKYNRFLKDVSNEMAKCTFGTRLTFIIF